MTAEFVMTEAQLEKALSSAADRLPAYRELLDFYGPIFRAQEMSRKRAVPAPLAFSSDVLKAKRQGGFPLVNPAEFSIDAVEARALFEEVISIARKTPGKWAEFAEALHIRADSPFLDLKRLFERFLLKDDDFFADTAKHCGVDARMLGFVVYNSLWPSLTLCAEQLAVYLKPVSPWEKRYCPICGSPPGLAVLEEEGARAFFCSFCFHKWPAKRLYCPYCDNTNGGSLHYFYTEKEEGYRVDVCDRCGKYIKTLDLRTLTHPIFPPLELLTTLHLDMKAREAGHESAVSFPME